MKWKKIKNDPFNHSFLVYKSRFLDGSLSRRNISVIVERLSTDEQRETMTIHCWKERKHLYCCISLDMIYNSFVYKFIIGKKKL